MTFSEFKKLTSAEIKIYTLFGYRLTPSSLGYSDGEFKYSPEDVFNAEVDYVEARNIDVLAVYLKL